MSPVYSALIIESDPLLREMVAESLILHRPGLAAAAVDSPSEARLFIEEGQIDILVAGLPRSTEAVLGLLGVLESASEDVPAVICAEDGIELPPPETGGWAARTVRLPRPPALDALLEALDRQILARRDTVLHDISLPSFVQLLHHDRKTCTLSVVSGGRHGHLFMRRGDLVHAALPSKTGREAALEILCWPSPVVRVVNRFRARPTISESISSLLLGASILQDHALASLAE